MKLKLVEVNLGRPGDSWFDAAALQIPGLLMKMVSRSYDDWSHRFVCKASLPNSYIGEKISQIVSRRNDATDATFLKLSPSIQISDLPGSICN